MKNILVLKSKGFTVLELIIVIGIMCILIALVLAGLNSARSHSKDENRVTNVRTVAVGVQQYFNVCRQYPATLTGEEKCVDVQQQVVKMSDLVPDIANYNFNHFDTGKPDLGYKYAALSTSLSLDPQADQSNCVGFHIAVLLESNESFANQKSAFSPDPSKFGTCTDSIDDFDGAVSKIFDLKK